MFFGIEYICFAIAITILGGLIGIYLTKRTEEYLIASVEFIITGIIVYLCIASFGLLSTILFIVTGILILFTKGTNNNNKKLWAIPILTVVLLVCLILTGGILSSIGASNSIEIGNITYDIKNEYGYVSGDLKGDLTISSYFDYLEVSVKYYDSSNKIIYSGIAWNENNIEPGQTYHFTSSYFEEVQPTRAEIIVTNDYSGEAPIYTQNITLQN